MTVFERKYKMATYVCFKCKHNFWMSFMWKTTVFLNKRQRYSGRLWTIRKKIYKSNWTPKVQ